MWKVSSTCYYTAVTPFLSSPLQGSENPSHFRGGSFSHSNYYSCDFSQHHRLCLLEVSVWMVIIYLIRKTLKTDSLGDFCGLSS